MFDENIDDFDAENSIVEMFNPLIDAFEKLMEATGEKRYKILGNYKIGYYDGRCFYRKFKLEKSISKTVTMGLFQKREILIPKFKIIFYGNIGCNNNNKSKSNRRILNYSFGYIEDYKEAYRLIAEKVFSCKEEFEAKKFVFDELDF